MLDSARRRRGPRALTPIVEGMESRFLLTTTGGRWSEPALVTYSFAPDGTDIGGNSSNLFSTLNARFATSTWEAQFRRAAAVWEAVANVNLAEVPDDGSPFSTSGYQQDDPRFGDIRIGGAPGSSGTLATAFLPPAINGGTLAGDIVINTSQAWKINSDYDLQSVAIHEIGHALGMGHSAIAAADMYASYNGIKQSLNSDDTSSVQSIYGQRTQYGNTSAANSTVANLDASGQALITGYGLTSSADQNWFKITIPSGTNGTLQVRVQSAGLSSFSPKVTIYNASLKGLAAGSSTDYGATVTASVAGVTPGQVYYARVTAAASGPAGAGNYAIQVNTGSQALPPVPSPVTPVASQPDQGGGSSNQSTGLLGAVTSLVSDVTQVTIGRLTGWGEAERAPRGPIRHRHDHRAPSGSDAGAIAAPTDAPVAPPTHRPAHRAFRLFHGRNLHRGAGPA